MRARQLVPLTLILTLALITWISSGASAAAHANATSTSTVTMALPYDTFFDPVAKAAQAQCARQGIKLQYTNVNEDYNAFTLKMEVEAQAGNAPDLMVDGLDQIGAIGRSSYFVNLQPLIQDQPTLSPKALPTIKFGRSGGKLAAIPWSLALPVVWINRDIFKAAGIKVPARLASWTQLAQLARRLTDSSKKQYGLAFADDLGWIPLNFLIDGGSNIVTSSGKVAFDNPAGLKVARFLHGLFADGSAFPGTEAEANQQFVAGHVGMWVEANSGEQSVAPAKFQWTALPFPPQTAGRPAKLATGGQGIAMLAPPPERSASLKAIACFLGAQGQTAITRIGYLPSNRGVHTPALDALLNKAPDKQASSEYSIANPWINFPGANASEANTVFDNAWNSAIRASADPAASLAKAAGQISQIIGS